MTAAGSRVVRLCAGLDLLVTGLLAVPFVAPIFVSTLYALDRALGGTLATPDLTALGWFMTNLAGVLGVLWALARMLRPRAWLARADVLGRCVVAALLVWHLAAHELPALLWAFVGSELAGAAAQAIVTRRASRAARRSP